MMLKKPCARLRMRIRKVDIGGGLFREAVETVDALSAEAVENV